MQESGKNLLTRELSLLYNFREIKLPVLVEGDVVMELLPLNFPVFYQCAVKGNTNLRQYDAVSILLLGNLRKDSEEFISDAEATGYISGKKRIKKEILTQVTRISDEEARERINDMGFQNLAWIADAIRELLSIVNIPLDLQKKIRDNPDDLATIAEVFVAAIKCPPKSIFPLGIAEKAQIALCYSKENAETFMEGVKDKEEFLEKIPEYSKNNKPKSRKSTVLSQEEIEALLGSASSPNQEKLDEPEKETISVFSESLPPVPCSYYFYDRSIEVNFFFELANMALSAGITGFTDLFELFMTPYVPYLEIYDNFYHYIDQFYGNRNIRVCYKFFVGSVDDYRVPDERNIEGIIMIDLSSDFVQNFCDKQISKQELKFISSTQKQGYQISIHNEIGNIFSGLAATAISNFIDRPTIIKAANEFEMNDTPGANEPIIVGIQPFRLNDGRVFRSAMIVPLVATSKMWELYKEQI